MELKMPSHFLLTFSVAVLLTAASSQPPTATTTTYPNCNHTFSCGTITNVTYPFTGGDRPSHCGLPDFVLTRWNNTTTELSDGSLIYRVLQLDQTQKTLILSRSDLYNDTCPSEFHNTTLNSTLFSFDGRRNEVLNLFYGCNSTAMNMRPHNLFSCNSSDFNFTDAYYLTGPVPRDPILRILYCSVGITVRIPRTVGNRVTAPGSQLRLGEALMEGFSVNYSVPYERLCIECGRLGGQCGFDSKRRWGSWWSLYWCFGSYKHSKRIGHAVLVSEPTSQAAIAPAVENRNQSATIVLPFIAPPSSPASFLQLDPPSGTQSPAAGLLSLASLSVHAYSPGGTAPIFTIGPYAHETQLVSPPVFSTFTTEPSTACFTPPPEPVQMTTPSSPEVPFAQLLSSSLARNRRKCEFQPYQYPGSPGGHTKSPGSAISTSGTSSPFPDKLPVLEFRMSEAPKFIGYEHFLNYKWGSRVGSGSLTPNGWGSRLGSGTLTPNGGLSRLGSGTLTPNGEVSRLGSGTLTPTGIESEPASRDINILENQISGVALLANSDQKLQNDGGVVDHRVSFELNDEDIPTCIVREPLLSPKIASSNLQEAITNQKNTMTENTDSCREHSDVESFNASPKKGDKCHQKHRTISLGSSKDFNFNSADKSTIDCEWWTNDKVVKNELGPQNNWTFFPMLQSGVS